MVMANLFYSFFLFSVLSVPLWFVPYLGFNELWQGVPEFARGCRHKYATAARPNRACVAGPPRRK